MTRSPDIYFISFMVHYAVPTNRGKTFGTTAITEENHSRFVLPGRYTKTNVSFSLPLSHLLSQVFLRFYQVMHFQISQLEMIIILPRLQLVVPMLTLPSQCNKISHHNPTHRGHTFFLSIFCTLPIMILDEVIARCWKQQTKSL